MDELSTYVQDELQSEPFSGFWAKRADRVKLLFCDQTGLASAASGWSRSLSLASDRAPNYATFWSIRIRFSPARFSVVTS